jgi:hypothetical protein
VDHAVHRKAVADGPTHQGPAFGDELPVLLPAARLAQLPEPVDLGVLPGERRTPLRGYRFAWMNAKVAPWGSATTAIVPCGISVAGTITPAPAALAFSSVAAQSATSKYTSQ